jgi:hypothetical protein
MSTSIEAGELRNCPFCGSRNKASFKYCVRCNVVMDAPAAARPVLAATGYPTYAAPAAGSKRLLLAAGAIALIAAGLAIRTVVRATQEASVISEDARADSAGPVLPPPPISGWSPGAGAPAEPDPAPARWSTSLPRPASVPVSSVPVSSVPVPTGPSSPSAPAPSGSDDSLPVARPNPYDVPGDPNTSMVGIAPRAPRAGEAMARKRVFTEQDLLETRGAGWSAPPAPEPVRPQAPPPDAERSDEMSKRDRS